MTMTPIVIKIGFLFLISGIAIRIWRIAAMPVHLRWELYPLPASTAEKIRIMISEILWLRGVYAHHRALWLWSWIMHASLYIVIGAAGLAFLAALSTAAREGITPWVGILSLLAFAGGTVGAAALILMRFTSRRMRPLTSFASVFNLVLLLAVFASGLAFAWLQPDAAQIMVEQAGHLLALNPAPRLHPAAIAHLSLAAFCIAYFPFTPMAHAVLKYFTYHSVRWDDRPVGRMPEYAVQMKRYLAFPVSWSAPHIRVGPTQPDWREAVSTKDPGGSTDNGQGAQA